MTIIVFLGLISAIAALAVLRGFVLSILWQWFAIPLGLPEIGVAHAIGIALVVALLTHQHRHNEQHDPEDTISNIIAGFVSCLLFLLVGWIIHFFM